MVSLLGNGMAAEGDSTAQMGERWSLIVKGVAARVWHGDSTEG